MLGTHQWIHRWTDEIRALRYGHFPKAISWHQASEGISDSAQSMRVMLKVDGCLVPVNSEWIKWSFYMLGSYAALRAGCSDTVLRQG